MLFPRNQEYFLEHQISTPDIGKLNKYWEFSYDGSKSLDDLKPVRKIDFLYVDAMNNELTKDDFSDLINFLILLSSYGVLIQIYSKGFSFLHNELETLNLKGFILYTFSRNQDSLNRNRLLLVFNYDPYDISNFPHVVTHPTKK